MSEPENDRFVPRILSDASYRAGVVRRALQLREALPAERRTELDPRLHDALGLPVFLKVDEVPLDTLSSALAQVADRDVSILESLVLPLWRQAQPPLVRAVAAFLREEADQGRDRLHRLNGMPTDWTADEIAETLAAFALSGAEFAEEDVETVLVSLELPEYESALTTPAYIGGEWGSFLEPWQALDEFDTAWDEVDGFIAALTALGQDKLQRRMAGRETLESALAALTSRHAEKLGFFGIPAAAWSADRAPLREAGDYAAEVDALGAAIDSYSALELHPVSTMEERRRLRERMAVVEDTVMQRAQHLAELLGPGAAPDEEPARGDAGVPAAVTEEAAPAWEAAPADEATEIASEASVAEEAVPASDSVPEDNGYSVVVEETILLPESAFDAGGDAEQVEGEREAVAGTGAVGG